MNKKMKYNLCLLAAVIWMAVIFINSSLSGDRSEGFSGAIVELISNLLNYLGRSQFITRIQDVVSGDAFHSVVRKTAHFIEFGILGLFLSGWLGIFEKIKKRYLQRVGLATLLSMIYAVSDEVHQLFVPGRVCSIYDILIDTLGALLFSLVSCIIIPEAVKGRKSSEKQ